MTEVKTTATRLLLLAGVFLSLEGWAHDEHRNGDIFRHSLTTEKKPWAVKKLNKAQPVQFRAGAACVDMTPTVFPIQLRSGKSNYVHDPLHVRAVAFERGDGRAVICLIDAIGIGRDMSDLAKARAAEKTGWKPEEMLICATHTHSAPKGGEGSPGREAYEKLKHEKLEEAIVKAIQALQPARVGFGSDEEPSEVRNRRWFLKAGTMPPNPLGEQDQVKTNANRNHLVKPAGPIDPELCVIDVRTTRNKPLALIANYALHYVGGIPKVKEEDGRLVGMASADYFGEFSRVMPYRIGGSNPPEDFVALMTNGASGDINNLVFSGTRAPRSPFEQVRIVASKAADTAWRAVKKIENYDDKPIVAVLQREVDLPYRKPARREIILAEGLLKKSSKERGEINKRTTSVANRVIEYSGPEHPETEPVLIQAVRIGEQSIVSMPFEVLVEIGLEIKEKSPFERTFLIGLANGGYGYLPPPNQHKLGGYETWLGTSRFQPQSSDLLIKQLLEMLQDLKKLK
jgi:neutral ceramidase